MIHERLKELLIELDMSQRQFALYLDIDGGHLSRILSGKRQPSSKTIYMIVNKFNVNKDWLENGIGPMFTSDDSPSKKRLLNSIEKLNEEQIKAVSSFIKYLNENA